MAGKFHPRVVHTESINRFRGIHDPDQKHNLPQEYVEGMSNLPSMRIGEARTRQGQELLESYDAGVNTGASLIRNRVIGEGGNLWAEELSRIVLMSIYDYAPPPVVVPYEIPDVIIDPADIDPLPDSVIPPITLFDDSVFPPTPPEPSHLSPFITVWETTEPNQTIGYQGPIGASGFSGTISVYNHATNELLSTNEYTGPKDSALWPMMENAGTYRIEISGGFPFIDANYINDYNWYLLIKVISLGETNLDPLGLKWAFSWCENLILCELGSADFSHITSLERTWHSCTLLVDFPNVSGFTAVTTLQQTWSYCESMVDAPAVFTLINVENLSYTWRRCESLTSAPDVSNLIKVTDLTSTWHGCTSLTAAPDVSTLTEVTLLYDTWGGCESLTSAPDVSNLIKVTDLSYTWYGCTSLTAAPDVSTLTEVTLLYGTWRRCESLTSAPDVSNLIKVTDICSAWSYCSGIVSAPDVSSLVNVKYIDSAWAKCSFETAPDISNLVNVVNMRGAFSGNDNLITASIPNDVANFESGAYTGGYYFLSGSNKVGTVSIDDILNKAYASVLANGGAPTGVYLHLGTNKYTSAGQDAYNYLSLTAGWRIDTGGLA